MTANTSKIAVTRDQLRSVFNAGRLAEYKRLLAIFGPSSDVQTEGMNVRAFADAAGMLRKQVRGADGRGVWVWAKRPGQVGAVKPFAEDAEGHEHGKDGKFTSKGGSDKGDKDVDRPRTGKGKPISKKRIRIAAKSKGEADELRERVTDPAERKKLDAAIAAERKRYIGGRDLSRQKKADAIVEDAASRIAALPPGAARLGLDGLATHLAAAMHGVQAVRTAKQAKAAVIDRRKQFKAAAKAVSGKTREEASRFAESLDESGPVKGRIASDLAAALKLDDVFEVGGDSPFADALRQLDSGSRADAIEHLADGLKDVLDGAAIAARVTEWAGSKDDEGSDLTDLFRTALEKRRDPLGPKRSEKASDYKARLEAEGLTDLPEPGPGEAASEYSEYDEVNDFLWGRDRATARKWLDGFAEHIRKSLDGAQAFAEDSQGHEHGKDGKFAKKGGGGGDRGEERDEGDEEDESAEEFDHDEYDGSQSVEETSAMSDDDAERARSYTPHDAGEEIANEMRKHLEDKDYYAAAVAEHIEDSDERKAFKAAYQERRKSIEEVGKDRMMAVMQAASVHTAIEDVDGKVDDLKDVDLESEYPDLYPERPSKPRDPAQATVVVAEYKAARKAAHKAATAKHRDEKIKPLLKQKAEYAALLKKKLAESEQAADAYVATTDGLANFIRSRGKGGADDPKTFSEDSQGHEHDAKDGKFAKKGGGGKGTKGAGADRPKLSDEQRDALKQLHALFPDGLSHLLDKSGAVDRAHFHTDEELETLETARESYREAVESGAKRIQAAADRNAAADALVTSDAELNDSLSELEASGTFAQYRDEADKWEGADAVVGALDGIASALEAIEGSDAPGHGSAPDAPDNLPDADPDSHAGEDGEPGEAATNIDTAREEFESEAETYEDESNDYVEGTDAESKRFRGEQAKFIMALADEVKAALAIPADVWDLADDGPMREAVKELGERVERIRGQLADAKGKAKGEGGQFSDGTAKQFAMESRPGLTLKTVTDKNGKQTRRWVRANKGEEDADAVAKLRAVSAEDVAALTGTTQRPSPGPATQP